jgi:hypothetical protein
MSSVDRALLEKGYWAMNGSYYGLTTPPAVDLSTLKRHDVPIEGSSCPYCKMNCYIPSILTTHIGTVHMKLRPFNCDYCHIWLCSKRSANKHISGVHRKWTEDLTDEDHGYEVEVVVERKSKIRQVANDIGLSGRFGCSRVPSHSQRPWN